MHGLTLLIACITVSCGDTSLLGCDELKCPSWAEISYSEQISSNCITTLDLTSSILTEDIQRICIENDTCQIECKFPPNPCKGGIESLTEDKITCHPTCELECPLWAKKILDKDISSNCETIWNLDQNDEFMLTKQTQEVCIKKNSCQIICQIPENPCEYGIQSFNQKEIMCNQPQCTQGQERCINENQRQVCNLSGIWETLACATTQKCALIENERTVCQATCGDGLKDSSEECDDGNQKNNDDCSSSCQLFPCGLDCLKNMGLKLKEIQGGTFLMGDDQSANLNEKPAHQVYVQNFLISTTEITVSQYKKCVETGVCEIPATFDQCNWSDGLNSDLDSHPINCIDWRQARIFAKWVGGDLPTEAQWEYVATSQGLMIKHPWGNTEATCDLAIMNDSVLGLGCQNERTWPVCSKTNGNSRQGLCDLSGNVSEWVLDEWHASYQNAPDQDAAWCDSSINCNSNTANRIHRGGAWIDLAIGLRSKARRFVSISSQTARTASIGFRIVRKN